MHGLSWIATSIPRFAERVAPLRKLLEAAYAKAGGSRKKQSIANIALNGIGWNEAHDHAFTDLQQQIQESVKLAHREPDLILCIHADASDLHWAVCATQCLKEELKKPIHEQQHQPLAFLSGAFTETEAHWTTYEREAFAIVQAFRKLDYLLACDLTTRVFTDHRNLLFIFNPIALESGLGRHTVLKVIRWALYLSTFTYAIEHLPGDPNIWPDIMTRWMRGYRRDNTSRVRRVTEPMFFDDVTVPPDAPEFDWPTMTVIVEAQSTAGERPPGLQKDGNGPNTLNGETWIPDESTELKMRLLTIAHAGSEGHRGIDATRNALKGQFWWTDIDEDVKAFNNACLLCVLSKSGNRVPRPLSSRAHASKPNEIIHFDYLFLGDSEGDEKYVLVVKDDLSSYCWLEPSSTCDSAHVSEVLARWNRVFTTPKLWVSDQGSHFKNEVVESLSRVHRIRHTFTVAYSPWANGTVEALMRPILSATRALLAESKLAAQDWLRVIPVVMSVLNQTGLERLG